MIPPEAEELKNKPLPKLRFCMKLSDIKIKNC